MREYAKKTAFRLDEFGSLTAKNEEYLSGMFYGEFTHAVDAKKRIRIPTKFKLPKGEEYVFSVLREGVISVYSSKTMDEKFAVLKDVSPFDEELCDVAANYLGNFYSAEEDGQGRVMIPEPIRRQVAIGSEVVTIGMGDHIDIMSKERREEVRKKYTNKEVLAKLNELYKERKNGN